jgi:hypothetical protein
VYLARGQALLGAVYTCDSAYESAYDSVYDLLPKASVQQANFRFVFVEMCIQTIPGQTFALVLVTDSTRISFFFFLSHSAALPLFHPKNVEAGTQRIDFF